MQRTKKNCTMVLTTPKQIKGTAPPVLQPATNQAPSWQATVSISGYFYRVDLGPEVRPRYHTVGKDRHCTCSLGANCPAVKSVADYLYAGGERAPDIPPGYFPVVPQACPICGAETYYVPSLNSRRRGAGWACVKGKKAHYWEAHVRVLRQNLANHPWLYPPVIAADGRVLYPGLRRDEIITESPPWPDEHHLNK